jgi:hypothetical protein
VTHSYDLHGALDGDTNEGDTDMADLEPEENGSAVAPGALVAVRYDTKPISRDVAFGDPVVDTRGSVSLCRYQITAPVNIGPISIPELELIVWSDSRFTFCWEAHNRSRKAPFSVAFEGKWMYRHAGHEAVAELGVPGFDYFRIGRQRWARRTRRRYNTAFRTHFQLLSRNDVQGVVRLTVQRDD